MYQKATTFAFRDSNELTSYLKTPRIQPSEKFDSVTWWFENRFSDFIENRQGLSFNHAD